MESFFDFLTRKIKGDVSNPTKWIVFIIVIGILFYPILKSNIEMTNKSALLAIYCILFPVTYILINWFKYRRKQK